MLTNYHTHTTRCGHAEGTEEEYILTALRCGYKVLGFSDHTPWAYATPTADGTPSRWNGRWKQGCTGIWPTPTSS